MKASAKPVPDWDAQESFLGITLIYDHLVSARNATQLLQKVTQTAGQEAAISLWKLEHLGLPQMEEAIAKDVVEADLIILCCPRDLSLPENLQILLERWSSRHRETPRALAVLLSSDSGKEAPKEVQLPSFLHELERQHPISVFLGRADPNPHPCSINRSLAANLPPLSRHRHPSPDWGLNE